MLHTYFNYPLALILLVLPAVLVVVAILAESLRRRALRLWGASPFAFRRRGFGFLTFSALLSGLTLLVMGIAGPQWGLDAMPEPATGRDLVCILDMSRSMLAEDILPNRLERAKSALEQLSWAIQKRGGYRVALVVFAGRAQVVCPLTHDYDHFRDSLAQVDLAEIGVEPGANGGAVSGTRIGAALVAAVQAHSDANRGFQDILLISDGDDPVRDNEWQGGIEAARSARIPVYVVGVGDPVNEQSIPGPDGSPLRHNKKVVTTRLDEPKLEQIATETGGMYLPGRTGELLLGDWFEKSIVPKSAVSLADERFLTKSQRYAWPLGFALFFLAVEIALSGIASRTSRSRQV
jgi:Ca-activated chloride channel family protein